MGCGASQALQWKADGRFLDARHTYVAPGADNGGKCDDEVSSRFGYVASARIPAPAVPAAILGPEPQPPSYVRGAGRRLEADEADAPAVPPVENQAPSRDAGCLELGGQPQAARQGGISATPDDLQEETQVETSGSDGLIQEECSACGVTGRTLGKAGEEFVTAGGSSTLPEVR